MTESRMSAVDYVMHRGEKSARTRSGIVSVEILDRVPDWDRIVETFDRTARVVTRMRQKVVVPALPTTAPRWVTDPDFDLKYHVRRIRVPEPGTHRQLLDMAEVIVQSTFDLSRPLWTATLVEGLEGGRAALVMHLSHAVTDGVGAIELFAQVYDLEREADRGPLPAIPAAADLGPTELAVEGMSELPGHIAGGLLGLAARAARGVAHPRRTASETLTFAGSVGRVVGASSATEPSALLKRRGIGSRTVTLDLDLDQLKRSGKELGGSLNDAFLAGLCAGLRNYHEEKGVPIDALPLTIPVNIRTEDDEAGGNRIAAVSLAAPIGERDPARRIELIRSQIAAGRKEPALDLMGRLAGVAALLPDPALDALIGTITPPDIQASNIPSFPGDTYLAGTKVLAQYGLGPLPGIAAMVVFVTRMGRCFITVRYDTAAVADGDAFERCLNDGFAELMGVQP